MGTQYNPNPNGASGAGWTLTNVTPTFTGDGVRLRKVNTGIGGATQTIGGIPTARLTLAGMQIKRNSADPLPAFIYFYRPGSSTVLETFEAYAAVGQWVTLPLISIPTSADEAAFIRIDSDGKYDVTVRHLYVYAYGDSSATSKAADLDAGDAAWTLTARPDSLTVTAKWNAANDEWVDELEWKAASGNTPYSLPASLIGSHTETWTYGSAGTVNASLTVRNSLGDSYQVTKTFSVPSGVYQAGFDYEAEYVQVEVEVC